MDPSVYVNVNFENAKWQNAALPTKFSKNVRFAFLIDKDGNPFPYDDLKEILKSWLHDEFNECPMDFDFQICP